MVSQAALLTLRLEAEFEREVASEANRQRMLLLLPSNSGTSSTPRGPDAATLALAQRGASLQQFVPSAPVAVDSSAADNDSKPLRSSTVHLAPLRRALLK